MKRKKKTTRPKVSRRKILMGSAAVLILAAAVFGLFTYLEARRAREAEKFKQETKKIWQQVLDKSSRLEVIINKTQAQEDLKPLSEELSETEDYATKQLYEIASLTATSKYLRRKRELMNALGDYSDYLTRAQQVALRLSNGKGKKDDVKELKSGADKARKSCKKFVKQTGFIKKDIPERVFSVALRLQLIIEKSKLGGSSSLIEEAEERGKAIVEARRKEEENKVRDVARKWLDGEVAGGTSANWKLASTRFKEQTLSNFPPDQQNQETYLQLFREGEVHFHLLSYEIVEVFILSRGEALVSMVATRQKIDGSKTPLQQEELPLITENSEWLVDGVGF